MFSGVVSVQLPLAATTNAVKFWGAAAGVASTVNAELVDPRALVFAHVGLNATTNPELGKPRTEKQISPEMGGKPVNATLAVAFPPTLIASVEGLTVKVGCV